MDALQTAACVYNSLLRKQYYYNLSDGNSFDFFFAPRYFKHMIGLHKLKDITFPQNKNTLYYQILNGNISLKTIKKSRFYSKIEDRIKYFPELENMLSFKTTYEFDKNLVVCQINTKINTKYFFYDYKYGLGLYFGVAYDKGKNYFYPETFFPRSHDRDFYIKNQKLLNILYRNVIPKYNLDYFLPNDLNFKINNTKAIIGIYPALNDLVKGIESINTSIEVIGQQRYLLQCKENQYGRIEQYIKTRDEASAALGEIKGNSKLQKELYNELSASIVKMNKLFSLSGYQNIEEFKNDYFQFLKEKDVLFSELDTQHNSFTKNLNTLYDAKNSLENYLHREIINFYKNYYPGASKWTLKDTNLIHGLNESHSKALTLKEINQLQKTDTVNKVLELFKDNSHNRTFDIER